MDRVRLLIIRLLLFVKQQPLRGPPLPPGKGQGPSHFPPVCVGGLVCGGWYKVNDPSEQHRPPNRTEQIEISKSGFLTVLFWAND